LLHQIIHLFHLRFLWQEGIDLLTKQQNKTKQNKTKQNKTKQNKTKQNKQNKKQNKTKQNKKKNEHYDQ